MSHKYEHVSTGNGFSVKNGDETTEVINQDGSINATVAIDDSSVTLAKLATLVSPSHVVKFVALGSTITTTALAGLAVGDLVIQIIAADGTVTAKLCATAATLPTDPADLDYIIVLRATA